MASNPSFKFEPRNTALTRTDVEQLNKIFEQIGLSVTPAPVVAVKTSAPPGPGPAVNSTISAPASSPDSSGVSPPTPPPPAATVATDGETIIGTGVSPNPIALIAPNGNHAVLQITTALSIPDGTVTALAFASGGTPANPVSDTAGFYNSANNTRLTAPVTGIYSLNAIVRWAANSAGQRQLLFFKNGSRTGSDELAGATYISGAAGDDPTMSISWQGLLLGGDYVEACVFQNGTVGPVSVDTQYQTFTICQAPF